MLTKDKKSQIIRLVKESQSQSQKRTKSKSIKRKEDDLVARLVDVIEQMIKEMVEENDGTATICRSQLAEQANCVPSQITYVLSTRFSGGSG